MQSRQAFFEELRHGLDTLVGRAEPLAKLSEAQLNAKTSAHPWSIGQQMDHLLLSGVPYVGMIRDSLPALGTSPEQEIGHSMMGRFILKAAGPGGKGPVPPPFIPAEKQHTSEIVQAYLAHVQDLQKLLPDLLDKEITRFKLASPASKMIKFTVADILAITAAHGERHLAQCESIQRASEFPNT